MKKKSVAAMLMSAAMVMTLLTGCGLGEKSVTAQEAQPAAEAGETEAEGAAETESTAETGTETAGEGEASADSAKDISAADVQAIIDRGVLRVGVKNAVVGFGYQDELTGEYSGMEIDLAEKIAESLGVDVEFTTVTAATRTELLDSGDIDCVLATFTITDERKESWDFSTPYYTDYVTVLVQKDTGIASINDLVDKKVGVSSGSTSARSLVAAMVENGVIEGAGFDSETFDPATWTDGISFAQYDDYPTISTALSAGEVDAFCVDKSILAVYHTDDRTYIEDKFAPQDYGVATVKGSGLSAYVENLITGWLSDGTIAGMIAENGIE